MILVPVSLFVPISADTKFFDILISNSNTNSTNKIKTTLIQIERKNILVIIEDEKIGIHEEHEMQEILYVKTLILKKDSRI